MLLQFTCSLLYSLPFPSSSYLKLVSLKNFTHSTIAFCAKYGYEECELFGCWWWGTLNFQVCWWRCIFGHSSCSIDYKDVRSKQTNHLVRAVSKNNNLGGVKNNFFVLIPFTRGPDTLRHQPASESGEQSSLS